MKQQEDYYAIDFGTSNSLLSYVPKNGQSRIIPMEENQDTILKSLIFTPEKGEWYFGRKAIHEYNENGGEGRFFRSIKKFLPDLNFKGTELFGRKVSIEELISIFLREMKSRADKVVGHEVKNVLLGRPAKYSLKKEEDKLAEDRMFKAASLAGFTKIDFCPEPLAAGLDFDQQRVGDKIVLVADFGGGTSDFTLLKMSDGPYSSDNILGMSGIFLAGDSLDGSIMQNFVSSEFGKDVTYQVPGGNNILRFPRRLLKRLCSPAHIVFLKERDTWEFLKEIQKWSVGPAEEKILDQLFMLVEEQLGYPVYSQIEKSKIALGLRDKTVFEFKHGSINIKMDLQRRDLEQAVKSTVEDIIKTMMDVFIQSGLSPEDVDHVCITGGTGQFPMLRNYLSDIFGKDKLSESEIFQSVVAGLAKYVRIINS